MPNTLSILARAPDPTTHRATGAYKEGMSGRGQAGPCRKLLMEDASRRIAECNSSCADSQALPATVVPRLMANKVQG